MAARFLAKDNAAGPAPASRTVQPPASRTVQPPASRTVQPPTARAASAPQPPAHTASAPPLPAQTASAPQPPAHTASAPPLPARAVPAVPPAPAATGRAPSMSDVAALAGVSHQTVSRVLAGHPNVRPHTRARVLTAVEELGYRPNTAARALATGRSRTLGVVSMNSTLYGPASMLYSIEEAAKLAGYFVTVASVRSFDRMSLHEATARLLGQAVDG